MQQAQMKEFGSAAPDRHDRECLLACMARIENVKYAQTGHVPASLVMIDGVKIGRLVERRGDVVDGYGVVVAV
jgi:hypothetical protein